MPPLTLEGNTLGEKHKNLNEKVIELISAETTLDETENSDINCLIQIEVAAKLKNVDYIIQVLKSEDMLYVSRAIKKCPWLITDQQYAHIINPDYLHTQLFPQMTTKAINKLLLNIRLNLREENRVNEFYKYYEESNPETAIKWLPNCSTDLIDEAAKKHNTKFNEELFKRLCKKSFAVFENFNFDTYRNYNINFKDVLFLLNTHTEKFLDVVEKTHNYRWPKYGKKHTAIIMKNCPNRILNKFQMYANNIDLETFGKQLGPHKIREFLLKEADNNPFLLNYKNVKPLIKLMPKEDKFEFLQSFFINKKRKVSNEEGGVGRVQTLQSECMAFKCAMPMIRKRKYMGRSGNQASSRHIYEWYRHAPFDVAFTELKKLIRAESSPEERGAIFRVLLTSAGQNMKNISSLIEYYNKNHINEPFKFKINFVNAIISTTRTHKYDEKTWSLLQELFHSMEVYIESDNNVQNCVKAIMIYNIVRQLPIPTIIEKKFDFNTFKIIQEKLSNEEKEALFKYLYNYVDEKIKAETSSDQEGFYKALGHLQDMLNLLDDWNKDLKKFPSVLDKIKSIVSIQQERKFEGNLVDIYFKKKSWSKYMIEESLLIAKEPKVCMNLLKHNPGILQKYESEVNKMRVDDKTNLNCFLSKLRVYWPESGKERIESYLTRLEQSNGQRATVRALCVLLPHNDLKNLLEKYAPDDTKILWGQIDNNLLGVRKELSKQMYSARPIPSPTSVLLYAKGDYLQFALPSLNSIFHNICAVKAREYLPRLLDNVVSLKKHGIRVAFSKLGYEKLREMLSTIWVTTKNQSLRAVIFKETFDLLCREKNPRKIEEIWTLLEHFINNLGMEENKMIYVLLGKANEAPPVVRPRFYVKSYDLLKSLPLKMNCESIAEQVCAYMPSVMDRMDSDFIAKLILKFLAEWFDKKAILKKPNYGHPHNMLDLISAYLLQTSTVEEQNQRYQQVFTVFVDHSIAMWSDGPEGDRIVEEYFITCLNKLIETIKHTVTDKKFVLPETVFSKISQELENKLPVEKNYHTLTLCKFMNVFLHCCKTKKSEIELIINKDEDEDSEVVPYNRYDHNASDKLWLTICRDFGKGCVELLNNDLQKYFPSVRTLFTDSLRQFHNMMSSRGSNDVDFSMSLVEGHDFTPLYLTAIDLSNVSYRVNEEDPEKDKIKEFRKQLLSHPSLEIKMYYYKKY